MKRKYAAVMLGLALTLSSLNVYAAGTPSTDTSKENTENKEDTPTDETSNNDISENIQADDQAETISGKVNSVGEDSITISVGTLKDREPGEDENREIPEEKTIDGEKTDEKTETVKDETVQEEDQQPFVLELTGEEQAITITKDTIIQRETKPELPDTEASDADIASSPDTAADTVTADTEDEDAENEDAENIDNAEAMPDTANDYKLMKTEPIELSNIMEGDIVTITLNEDGNAALITVLSQVENPEETMEHQENDKEDINSQQTKIVKDASEKDSANEDTQDEETSDAAE